MTLEERAKEFVSKIASGTSQEMDYYANLLVEFANETTKELEQENATLKKQLEALSGDIPWKDIKDKSEVIEQLAKAKEIISEFVKWANWQGSKCPSFKSILDKAEQFIKE